MNILMNFLASVFGFIYDVFFGCRHNRQTRPFTLEAETYKVCLDCGRQIYYSSERMSPLSAREVRRMRAARAQAGVVVMPHIMPSTVAERQALATRGRKSTAAA